MREERETKRVRTCRQAASSRTTLRRGREKPALPSAQLHFTQYVSEWLARADLRRVAYDTYAPPTHTHTHTLTQELHSAAAEAQALRSGVAAIQELRSGVAEVQALHSGVAAIHPQALHLEEEDFWILSQRQASEVLSEAEETRRTSVAAVGSHSSSLLTLLVQEVAARRTSAAAVGSQCYHHVRRRVHARHRVRHRVRCHSSSLLTLVPRSLAVAEETTQRAALAAALHSPSSAEPAVRSAAAGDFPSSLEEQRVAEDCSALL